MRNNWIGDYYGGSLGQEEDIISCVIDREKGSLGFIHNGKFLGIAYESEEFKVDNLYFAISMRFKGQSVQIVETNLDISTLIDSMNMKLMQIAEGNLFTFDTTMTSNFMNLNEQNTYVIHKSDEGIG